MSGFSFSPFLLQPLTSTYGMGLADINGDGHLDMFLGNHGNLGVTYINDGQGGFIRQAVDYIHSGDAHGVAFGDFDRDGDLDMIEATGGGLGQNGTAPAFLPNLLVNENGALVEADLTGTDLGKDFSRGRHPVLLDLNGDGIVDLVMGAVIGPGGTFPPQAYLGDGRGGFTLAPKSLLRLPVNIEDIATGDLTGDGRAEMVLSYGDAQAIRVLSLNPAGTQWVDITAQIFPNGAPMGGRDLILADFNSDGIDDIYRASNNFFTDALILPDGTLRWTSTGTGQSNTTVLKFRADGPVTFDFRSDFNLKPEEIRFGNQTAPDRLFTIDPADANGAVNTDAPVDISYDPATGLWTVTIEGRAYTHRTGVIKAENTRIESFEAPRGSDHSTPDLLFLSSPNGHGQGIPMTPGALAGTSSVGVGDFDNDGNLDLYLLRTTSAGNRADMVLMGRGDGTFRTEAGMGATLGIGDGVTVGDLNGDGMLDVVISDGAGSVRLNDKGRYYIGLNTRENDNNWLRFELVDKQGGVSPLGSVITVNGKKMRYDGGTHGADQNDMRLHFGLGTAQMAAVSVKWLSGMEQVFALPTLLLNRSWTLHETDLNATTGQRVTGTGRDDLLLGGRGADTLIGGDGNDYLDGGAGADRMQGGAGDDIYRIDHRNDVVMEAAGGGNDTAFVMVAHYVAAANVERWFLNVMTNNVFTGSNTAENIQSGSGNDRIAAGGGNDTVTGAGGHDTLMGGAGNDALFGGFGRDELYGGAGNDTLNGGPGNDTMWGGAGEDLYIIDSPGDRVFEGANMGHDTVRSSVTTFLSLNVEDLVLTGTAAINGIGNAGANQMIGNSGANLLSGGQGNDTLIGAGGADTLLGGAGDDRLFGGAGADHLTGGAGNDTLVGGAGADVFIFTGFFGHDIVTDFQQGEDRLDLSAHLTTGNFATTLHMVQQGNDTVLRIDGLNASITLRGVQADQLGADDFIL